MARVPFVRLSPDAGVQGAKRKSRNPKRPCKRRDTGIAASMTLEQLQEGGFFDMTMQVCSCHGSFHALPVHVCHGQWHALPASSWCRQGQLQDAHASGLAQAVSAARPGAVRSCCQRAEPLALRRTRLQR